MRSPRHVSNDVVQAAVGITIAIALSMPSATAQTPSPGPRELPARSVPVYDTVSPQMQKQIAAPLTPTWNVIPKTAEEWKAQVNAGAEATVRQDCPRFAKRFASRWSR